MIVIPMAGESLRFYHAGYTQPKYMLEAKGLSLFEHAVNSFENYFDTEPFLFIARDLEDTIQFIKNRTKKMGIKEGHIVALPHKTRGQAETVAHGLEDLQLRTGSITIFNIDTFRPHFVYSSLRSRGAGYLEVFQGKGENWSFVKPFANSTCVMETAEKRQISDLCCTGLYYFSVVSDYLFAYNRYKDRSPIEWEKGELYIAPLYNELITAGLEIHYHKIEREQVIFCGVPSEFEDFKRT